MEAITNEGPLDNRGDPSQTSSNQFVESLNLPQCGISVQLNLTEYPKIANEPLTLPECPETVDQLPADSFSTEAKEQPDTTASALETVEKSTNPVESSNETGKENNGPVPTPSSATKKKRARKSKPKPKFPCLVCGKAFFIENHLIVHSRQHNRTTYPCETCGKKFTKSSSLKDHLRVHTGERPFQCSVCNKSFTTSGTRNKHFKRCSGQVASDKTDDENIAPGSGKPKTKHPSIMKHGVGVEKKPPAPKRQHICTVCKKVFNSNNHLMVHFRTHSGVKPYVCPHCNKAFSQSGSLKTHIRIHTGEKPFMCGVVTCGKAYGQKVDLERHMRTHTASKPYSCEVCGKAFSLSSNLKAHLRVHNGDKPYSCPVCNKAFTTSSNCNKHFKRCSGGSTLTVHKHNAMLEEAKPKPPKPLSHLMFPCTLKTEQIVTATIINTSSSSNNNSNNNSNNSITDIPIPAEAVVGPILDSKDNTCNVCKKKFASKHHLTVHFRTHSGVKPYVCPHCNKAFSQSGSLKTHLRTHTGEKPYVCGSCGKSCSQKVDLERHMRTHTAVKPFTCEICQKSFSIGSNLKTHMRVHTGDKPFTCSICNKGFTTSSNCNKHSKRCSGKLPTQVSKPSSTTAEICVKPLSHPEYSHHSNSDLHQAHTQNHPQVLSQAVHPQVHAQVHQPHHAQAHHQPHQPHHVQPHHQPQHHQQHHQQHQQLHQQPHPVHSAHQQTTNNEHLAIHHTDSYWSKAFYMQYMQQDLLARQSFEDSSSCAHWR